MNSSHIVGAGGGGALVVAISQIISANWPHQPADAEAFVIVGALAALGVAVQALWTRFAPQAKP